ncbi:hypothetical protein FNV43_RR24488 [Rhamnella rubrinervis]|uniref:Uncharacterized protein n=1 Tax=Rhamnella rubrinervis TaxID=2594499 RepID=A0A8K0DMV9_9ROSA|nr:hypothetical protein FNV43_RR24488 [Rhamnella rubrinervis]
MGRKVLDRGRARPGEAGPRPRKSSTKEASSRSRDTSTWGGRFSTQEDFDLGGMSSTQGGLDLRRLVLDLGRVRPGEAKCMVPSNLNMDGGERPTSVAASKENASQIQKIESSNSLRKVETLCVLYCSLPASESLIEKLATWLLMLSIDPPRMAPVGWNLADIGCMSPPGWQIHVVSINLIRGIFGHKLALMGIGAFPLLESLILECSSATPTWPTRFGLPHLAAIYTGQYDGVGRNAGHFKIRREACCHDLLTKWIGVYVVGAACYALPRLSAFVASRVSLRLGSSSMGNPPVDVLYKFSNKFHKAIGLAWSVEGLTVRGRLSGGIRSPRGRQVVSVRLYAPLSICIKLKDRKWVGMRFELVLPLLSTWLASADCPTDMTGHRRIGHPNRSLADISAFRQASGVRQPGSLSRCLLEKAFRIANVSRGGVATADGSGDMAGYWLMKRCHVSIPEAFSDVVVGTIDRAGWTAEHSASGNLPILGAFSVDELLCSQLVSSFKGRFFSFN